SATCPSVLLLSQRIRTLVKHSVNNCLPLRLSITMPPKQNKAKERPKATGKRRKNDSDSSTGMDLDFGEGSSTDLEVALSIAEPRKTRASARACKQKIQGESFMDQAIKKAEAKTLHSVDQFDFKELVSSPLYDHPELVRKMTPEEFTMAYYNETGLNEVLVFDCPPEQLGMKMVDASFTPRDVERLVGGNRMISCVRVETQGSEEMKLKDFIEYYYKPKEEKERLYNVLSLEFSNTGLADLVRSPALVREIDWAASWPDDRKHRTVSFDKNDGRFSLELHYPRVENYCLMSPTACYTDFHIDFHGTSVWYHVKHGQKIFWIVEPSDNNIKMYEEYLKNPEQSGFYGDVADKCHRVFVNPGNTLIIPSGWIHAVYTPEDSLVFGGNFLHSRSVAMQIAVLQSENRIGINKRYRYPHSEEATFHMMSKLVKACTGREYVRPQSKNQQGRYREYVGEEFVKAGLHRRIPTKADYADDGAAWDTNWDESAAYRESREKLSAYDKEEEAAMQEEEEKKASEDVVLDANGLEAEAATDTEEAASMPTLSPKKLPKEPTVTLTIEELDAAEEERKRREAEKQKEKERKPGFGGHDDFFLDNSTFYHPESFNCDPHGLNSMHTMPVSQAEPPMIVDEAELLKQIPPGAVHELERLVQYTMRKPKVEVPYGLTRPNSLIWALTNLLRRRRLLAEECEGVRLPACILPTPRDNRLQHAQHAAAEAERKKRIAERRAACVDGEYDSDYDPSTEDKPSTKKKPRRSGDGGGGGRAMGTPVVGFKPNRPIAATPVSAAAAAAARNKTPRPPATERDKRVKQIWNKGFYAWYKTGKAKHSGEFAHLPRKQVREAVRKAYWVPLSREEKTFWMARGAEQYEDGFEADAPSTSAAAAALPADYWTAAAAGRGGDKLPLPDSLMDPEKEQTASSTVYAGLQSFQRFYVSVQDKYTEQHPHLTESLRKELAWQEWQEMGPLQQMKYDTAEKAGFHLVWRAVREVAILRWPEPDLKLIKANLRSKWNSFSGDQRGELFTKCLEESAGLKQKRAEVLQQQIQQQQVAAALVAMAAGEPSTSTGTRSLSPVQLAQLQQLQQ
ncbi:hypothetical protein PFISCL1PPCAC_9415, partial [Pristionchus fissidentatus]